MQRISVFTLLAIICLLSVNGWGATKYCAAGGADSGTTGPFASLEYMLESGGLAWGDTAIVQTGCAVLKSGTNNTINPVLSVGAGDFVVRSEYGVVLDIPASVTPTLVGNFPTPVSPNQFYVWAVDLTNTTGNASTLFTLFNASSVRIGGQAVERGNHRTTIDAGGTSSAGPYYLVNVQIPSGAANIDIYQAQIKNIRLGVVRNNTTAVTPHVTYRSSVFDRYGNLYYSNTNGAKMDLTLANISRGYSWGNGSNTGEIYLPSESTGITKYTEHNSIFVGNSTVPGAFYGTQTTAMADVLVNQASKWERSNNVVFSSSIIPDNGGGAASAYFDNFWVTGSGNYYIPLDTTTWFLDPNFVDITNGNYSISAISTSWISGRGVAAYLPPADIDGNAWAGNDIGAHRNPTAAKQYSVINRGLAAIGGDSLAVGTGSQYHSLYPTEKFVAAAPSWNSTGTYAAYGGIKIGGYLLALDVLMTSNYAPQIFGVAIGANNGTPMLATITPYMYCRGEAAPYTTCAGYLADHITSVMAKFTEWGGGQPVYPTWLGLGPAKSTATSWSYANQQSWQDIVNVSVAEDCRANGWRAVEWPRIMQANSNWYTGDFQSPSGPGTPGPYFNCLYVNGNCLTANVHPTNDGYQFMARLANSVMTPITIRRGSSVFDLAQQ